MSTRRLTGLQQRMIERALAGGQHRIDIDAGGRVTILPLTADAAQAEDAALDAEIRGHIGDGDARH